MIRKRIISFLLVFSIVISLFCSLVTVSAVTPPRLSDTDTVEQWNLWIENNFIVEFPIIGNQAAFWRVVDDCFSASGIGVIDSRAALQQRANNWNGRMNSLSNWPSLSAYMIMTASEKGPWAVIGLDSNLGVYRLYDQTTGLWLVDSAGRFPYYADPSSTRQDTWLPFGTATKAKQVSVLTKDSLSDLAVTINQTDRTCSVRDTYINGTRFYVIVDSSTNIYANADGSPYVAHYEATVTDTGRDYIINEGDTLNEGDTIYNDNSTIIEGSTTNYEIVDNSKVVDLTNGTLNYIGEQNLEQFYIDELIYDFSSQSYSADTYNVTYDNDTYNTWNYTWNITYNITNTYVTNIGQTALYEPLELYYALPDGRSSADLTAEEVIGMSFEFADCVNYAKSATDTYLRALYHFDGNTTDSSYFSTQGKFEWVKGASISYMDVGTFDGALYLGPEAHEFKITLPSNIGSGDFTLQFRYYQEGAADTQSNIENSLSIGGTTVLQWDEGSIYNGSGIKLTALAIGTWQEFAVVRHSGILYLYHNGLFIGSGANASALSGTFSLALGDTTRASSMIDELRVVNFAVAESGAPYICTSVPYDTNTVLVLPDSEFPIADEYWNIESSYNNLLSQYGLDWWTSDSIDTGIYSPYFVQQSSRYNFSGFPYVNLYTGYSQFSCGKGTVITGSSTYGVTYRNNNDRFLGSLYSSGLVFVTWSDLSGGTDFYINSPLTLSMVDTEGNVGSFTSNLSRSWSYSYQDGQTHYDLTVLGEFNGYEFVSLAAYHYSGFDELSQSIGSFVIRPTSSAGEFVYLELVSGSKTDLTAEFVNCMYSSEEVKPNTAAIQTDIPIKGYTVGGVRPTFPVRGDVWMPVSNNRISGCYVYNGSSWEQVNARWYTGTRWIPIYSFDLTTLEDCWDISDGDKVISPIPTEQDFWTWWKNAWTDFRSWFSGALKNNALPEDTTQILPDDEKINLVSPAGLPSGYTQVEYIETSGTQFIDTGINGHMGYDYEINFQFVEGGAISTDIWGVSDVSDYSFTYNMSFTYGGLGGMCFRITLDDAWLSQLGSADTEKHTYKIKDGKWYLDSASSNIPENKRSYAFSHHPYLGGINYGSGRKTLAAPAKYYSYKVWDLDGNLIQDFVPCISPYSEVGFYDIVNNIFYSNSGSGDFIAGDPVFVVEVESYSFIDLIDSVVGSVWNIVTGIVRTATGGITGIFTAVINVDGFFESFDDGSEIFGIVNYGGDDIWD